MPPSMPRLLGLARLIMGEDNDAVLKILIKGRNPTFLQSLLASYERKQKEAMEQAERILATARADAAAAADQAKTDLTESVARRMAAAEERISTAQASAEKEVRDAAIKVAIEAASEVISNQLSAPDANKLIDLGISEIENKLH